MQMELDNARIQMELDKMIEEELGRREAEVEVFIGQLEDAWNNIKPNMKGRHFPDVQAIVKYKMSEWLHESGTLRDATTPSPDGFGGWHKNPSWMIVCDASNNPPVEIDKNRIHATVFAKLYDKVVKHELHYTENEGG